MYDEHNGAQGFFPSVTFCNSHNQDTCIVYLSKELVSLGYAPLYNNGTNQCDQVKLINTIYSLLGQLANERNSHEEMQDRIVRLTSDLDTQRSHQSRLQERIETSEKNAQSHQEKYRQLSIKNKSLLADLKSEREECRRLQSMLQQREAQYQHEQRRRERELNQLKERLLQTMSHKTQQTPGMTMLNGLGRQDGRRGTWTTKAVSTRNEDDFQKRIVSGYEQRNKLLLEDNITLRELILTLYSEFNRVDNEDDDEDEGDATTSLFTQSSLYKTAGGFNSVKIQELVLGVWHSLKERWHQQLITNQDKSLPPKRKEDGNSECSLSPCDSSKSESEKLHLKTEEDFADIQRKGVTIVKG